MAAPKAPVLGGAKKDVSLEESVFGVEIKPHLVHEAVRAELNEHRQGTRAAKSRGLVSGGRAKPWRQKGTGRARQGTIRAPQFTGGGVAFPPTPRDFTVKVNKKALKAALRSALSDHAQAGTIALLDPTPFDAPSTKGASEAARDVGRVDADRRRRQRRRGERLRSRSATSTACSSPCRRSSRSRRSCGRARCSSASRRSTRCRGGPS